MKEKAAQNTKSESIVANEALPTNECDASNIEVTIIDQRVLLGKDFKMYGTYDEPLFLAKDVAEWIGHSNSRMMLQSIDEDEKICVNNPYALKGQKEQWFLTENGLYEVLMQSRKPIAKEFKKQVKAILRDVRKHGAYMTPSTIEKTLTNPDFIIELATVLKKEQEEHKRLEVENSCLVTNNKLLAAEILDLSDRTMFNAVIHKFAGTMRLSFTMAYGVIYKQLKYKYGIDVKKRGKRTPPYIQYIKEDEWGKVQQCIAAILESNDINSKEFFDSCKPISKIKTE